MSGKEESEASIKAVAEKTPRTGAVTFLVVGTLALALFFVDALVSVYYYANSGKIDLRWLLALLDVALLLTVLSLAGKRVSRLLVSMTLALTLLFVTAILSIIGTLLPPKDVARTSDWVNNPLFDVYEHMGLFDMYYSRWFLFLLFLLAANLTYCIFKRLRFTLKNAIRPRVDVRDSFIENQPFGASFPGRDMEDFRRAIAGHRYRVHTAASGSALAQKGRFSALASIAFHLSFIFVGVGSILGGMLGWTDQVYIPDGERVAVPNTSLEAANNGFGIEYAIIKEGGRVVGYKPKEYTTDLAIYEGGALVDSKTITVNGPLRVVEPDDNGLLAFLGSTSVNFHQSSYDVTDTGEYATILEVNYMPGKLLIYIGLSLMMGGIVIALYFPHRRIWAKVGATGVLLVGGRTNRAKVSFGRDFERLKAELGQAQRQEADRHVQ